MLIYKYKECEACGGDGYEELPCTCTGGASQRICGKCDNSGWIRGDLCEVCGGDGFVEGVISTEDEQWIKR